MTDHRKEFLLQSRRDMHEAKQGMLGMSNPQRDAIKFAIKALDDATYYATECHDLRLSDLDKLITALRKLEVAMHTEPTEYQLEGFEEYGIDWEQPETEPDRQDK